MTARRILIFGKAGSGKTTLARRLSENGRRPILALDAIAWREDVERRPLADSVADLRTFMSRNDEWIIEGCYGDLVDAALHRGTELHFLNPGVAACVARCRARHWEPEKFSSLAEQTEMLEQLVAWVEQYESRQDEFGLSRHRAIFDAFNGTKLEHTE